MERLKSGSISRAELAGKQINQRRIGRTLAAMTALVGLASACGGRISDLNKPSPVATASPIPNKSPNSPASNHSTDQTPGTSPSQVCSDKSAYAFNAHIVGNLCTISPQLFSPTSVGNVFSRLTEPVTHSNIEPEACQASDVNADADGVGLTNWMTPNNFEVTAYTNILPGFDKISASNTGTSVKQIAAIDGFPSYTATIADNPNGNVEYPATFSRLAGDQYLEVNIISFNFNVEKPSASQRLIPVDPVVGEEADMMAQILGSANFRR